MQNLSNLHNMIEVTCAIIVQNNLILAVQRGVAGGHPLKWEFPGGKLNADETPEECIVREIGEELSVNVSVLKQFEPVEFDYGSKSVRLMPFVCKIISGQIVLNEHAAMLWFAWEDWTTIDWLEADRELILKNREYLKQLFQ